MKHFILAILMIFKSLISAEESIIVSKNGNETTFKFNDKVFSVGKTAALYYAQWNLDNKKGNTVDITANSPEVKDAAIDLALDLQDNEINPCYTSLLNVIVNGKIVKADIEEDIIRRGLIRHGLDPDALLLKEKTKK